MVVGERCEVVCNRKVEIRRVEWDVGRYVGDCQRDVTCVRFFLCCFLLTMEKVCNRDRKL